MAKGGSAKRVITQKNNEALDKAIIRWERKAYLQSVVGNDDAVESQRIFLWLSELRERRNE